MTTRNLRSDDKTRRNQSIVAAFHAGDTYQEMMTEFGMSKGGIRFVLDTYGVGTSRAKARGTCPLCGGVKEPSQARDCRACVDNMLDMWRAEQLKALGNGVVPQQAAAAIRGLLERAA